MDTQDKEGPVTLDELLKDVAELDKVKPKKTRPPIVHPVTEPEAVAVGFNGIEMSTVAGVSQPRQSRVNLEQASPGAKQGKTLKKKATIQEIDKRQSPGRSYSTDKVELKKVLVAEQDKNRKQKETLEKVDEKYHKLRGNYAELLTSFDQSEELRKVYKTLVVDQKNEIMQLKGQLEESKKAKSSSVHGDSTQHDDQPGTVVDAESLRNSNEYFSRFKDPKVELPSVLQSVQRLPRANAQVESYGFEVGHRNSTP